MAKRGKYERQKPKKKGRKILTIVLCTLLAIVLVAGIAGVVLYNNMLNKMNRVEVVEQEYTMTDEILAMMGTNPPTEATVATTGAATEGTTVPETTSETVPKDPDILNVLVVGQSFREGETSRLADTMILVTINKDTKVVTLTSFLRDTYVDLPDYMGHTCGWNRINTNYALGYVWGGAGGAMEMTNLCIKQNFGIEVDYNVEIDFTVFTKVIDILGGVRIELTQAECDYINGLGREWLQVVEPGENRLFGETALEYARMRKADGDSDSDIKRTERQRKLMVALFNKVITKGVSAIRDIANEILPMITHNMTNDQITECLFDVLPLLVDMKIETGTCPVQGYYWAEDKETPDGWASVLCFARNEQMALMMPITEGYAP
ncbi:MAG: LCP family protein [Oscillospiraceae bacterium]|nr:LCP family protein [Oscillospiraceae bacterium]